MKANQSNSSSMKMARPQYSLLSLLTLVTVVGITLGTLIPASRAVRQIEWSEPWVGYVVGGGLILFALVVGMFYPFLRR